MTEPKPTDNYQTNSNGRLTGTVKFFSNAKGWGFITADNGQELFVHYSNITGSGYRQLSEGDRVRFREANYGRGPAAVDVERVSG